MTYHDCVPNVGLATCKIIMKAILLILYVLFLLLLFIVLIFNYLILLVKF